MSHDRYVVGRNYHPAVSLIEGSAVLETEQGTISENLDVCNLLRKTIRQRLGLRPEL